MILGVRLKLELAGAVDTDKTVDMARNSEQPDLMHQLFKAPEREKATEDVNFKMRRSFSWDRAFFTNDGVLDADELSSIIEGGGNDVKHESRRIEEIESLEAKLFEESEASMKKKSGQSSIKMSSGERDSQEKESCFSPKVSRLLTTQTSKESGAISPCRDVPTTSLSSLGSPTPTNTQTARSSPLSGSPGRSAGTNVKSSETWARRKSGKTKAGSPSKTPPGISMKNKVPVFSKLSPRTSPARPISPGSSGSSASTSAVNQRSSRGSSVPRRFSVNSEKPTLTDARKKDDQKIGKPTVVSVPNKQSNISLKNKPPPVICHPSLPLGLRNSSPSTSRTSSIISQRPSESSSSTACAVDQRSISRGSRGSVHHKTLSHDASAKATFKNHPSRQTPTQNQKQPSALRPQSGSIISQPSIQSTGRGLPSPKFGFYEEGISYKSRLLAGLPKTDATQESRTGSSNSAKVRKLPQPKMAANHTSLKPNSPRSTTPRHSREQSSAKAKSSSNASRRVKNILLVSPEVLDIKGKLNALKTEISMQKNSKCKTTPAENGKGESSYSISSHYVGMKRTNNQA